MIWSTIFRCSLYCILLAVLSLAPGLSKAADSRPIIAVASNLRLAIEDVATSFQKETGHRVRFSFGSSGNLTRQILQGAPFAMFMSADEAYVHRLSEAGAGVNSGDIYAYGRIAIFIPSGSNLLEASFPDGFADRFSDNRHARFAIAKPELAPYGRAAKEALIHAGLWERMQTHLIYGENISQTAQFTLSGSALGGVIAYSQALSPQFSKGGSLQLIPPSWHQPLAQKMVLLQGADGIAEKFYDFVKSKQARDIFRRHGYMATSGKGAQ